MSKEKKRELNWYQANDSEAMARRLEKMAAKGWLLESVDSIWRTYRRDEPSTVRYAVTYFPDASVFDGSPTGGQETYADYCAAAGWEFVSAYGPIQYFRSTRPDPVPIETDEGEKLRSIHKTMLKTLVLAHCLLLVSVGVTTWSHTSSFRYAPLSAVSSNMTLGLYLLLAVLLVYLVAILADYFIWYFRSKASVARGGACKKVHTQARLMGGWVLIGALALCLAGTLSEVLKPGMAIVMAYSFGMAALLIVAIPLGLKWLKKRGLSRGVVRGGYIALCVGLGVLYAAGAGGVFWASAGFHLRPRRGRCDCPSNAAAEICVQPVLPVRRDGRDGGRAAGAGVFRGADDCVYGGGLRRQAAVGGYHLPGVPHAANAVSVLPRELDNYRRRPYRVFLLYPETGLRQMRYPWHAAG